jgi:hypothetical protein
VKIIFSRKGVDSQAGKLSSAIIGDRLVSIPIPSGRYKSTTRYRDLTIHNVSLARLVEDFSASRTERRSGDEFVHLDPDLRRDSLPRKSGWRPLLGLENTARLENSGVKEGDLFLFFGPFCPVEKGADGRYRYTREPKRHIIHGWLQIGRIVKAGPTYRKSAPDWMRYHPHFLNQFREPNTIYVSAEHLRLTGKNFSLPGGGSFIQMLPDYCLTAPGALMSQWRLPFLVDPINGKYPMSRFESRDYWRRGDHCMFLDTNIGHWQDEVLDASKCLGVITWLKRLFRISGRF